MENKQTTKDFINELKNQRVSKIKVFNPIKNSIYIAVFSFILTLIVFHFHEPLNFKNVKTIDLMASLMLISSIILYIYSFQKSLVPSAKYSLYLIIASILMAIFVLINIYQNYQTNQSLIHRHYCEVEAMTISLITTSLLHFYFKKFELVKLQKIPLLLLFAVPMTASFVLQLTCSIEIQHLITCHFLPILPIPTIYILKILFFDSK